MSTTFASAFSRTAFSAGTANPPTNRAFSSAFSSKSFSVEPEIPPAPIRGSSTSNIIALKRKEVSQRVVLGDGTAITVRVSDGILIDDLFISGMKAEGYRVMTGIDVFPDVNRKLKDYLIKTGIIQE